MADRLEGLRIRRIAFIVVGVVVSALALWAVTRDVDLARTSAVLGTASPGLLAVAAGVIAIQTVVRAIRWRSLLPPRTPGPTGRRDQPSIARVLPVLLVGYLGNAILPARLGEAARGVLIARREELPVAEALGSVLIERVLDTFVLAVLGIGAAMLIGVPAWIVGIGLVGVAVSIVAVGALTAAPAVLSRLSGGRLDRVIAAVAAVVRGANVAQRPAIIARAVLLSLVAWLLDASLYWLVGRSLGIELSAAGALLIATVTVLSTAVPSAPGYVGTFELAAVAAAGVLGIDSATALAFAVVAHAVVLVPIALAGAVALAGLGADARLLGPILTGSPSRKPTL